MMISTRRVIMAGHRTLGVFALFSYMILARPSVAQQTLFAVFFSDVNTGTVVGGSGTILHTSDGGATSTAQSSGTTQDLWGVFFTDAITGNFVGPNNAAAEGTGIHI